MAPVKHGHSKRGQPRTPTYYSWAAMVRRCTNPNTRDWPLYGGRGVTVCDRWRVFANFLADMGERPPGMTIHRRDSNKGYGPENCCWADNIVQARERRPRKLSEGQWAALLIMKQPGHEVITIQDIMQRTGRPKGTVQYTLHSLVVRGLAAHSGTTAHYCLTPAGRELTRAPGYYFIPDQETNHDPARPDS